MKESKAREILEKLQVAIQKVRSNAAEVVGDDMPLSVLNHISEWIFSDETVLKAINEILEREQIGGLDFYNVITILNRLVPVTILEPILIISGLVGKFPREAQTAWIIGWDVE